MIETEIWQAPETIADGDADGDGASAADSNMSSLVMRLWTLLHSQALLRGTIGGVGGVSYIEDDRRRLAARWESAYRP
jgi:hypothetical protein